MRIMRDGRAVEQYFTEAVTTNILQPKNFNVSVVSILER